MRQSNQKGFTLIELIITIGIMGVLTTVVLANYHSAEQTRRVQLASDIVQSALRDAQNSSLSGKKADGCGQNNPYIVRLIYSSNSVTVGCTNKTYQTYTLPKSTRIKYPGIDITGTDGNLMPLDTSSRGVLVYYYSPFGTAKVCVSVDKNQNCTSTPTAFSNLNVTLENNATTLNYYVGVDGVSGKIQNSSSPTIVPETTNPQTPPSLNEPPVVIVTSPSVGTTFSINSAVSISVTATDPDGTVSQVYISVDGQNLSVGSSGSTYTASWTATTSGSHTISATATDTDGAISQPVTAYFSVDAYAPSVSLTSPTTSSYNSGSSGANISLAATAAGQYGATINRVDFMQNGNLVYSDSSSPYSYNWSPVWAGNYNLTATAYDNNGLSTTSVAKGITVIDTGSPTISVSSFTVSPNNANGPVTEIASGSVSASDTGGSHLSKIELIRATYKTANCNGTNKMNGCSWTAVASTSISGGVDNYPNTSFSLQNTSVGAGTYVYSLRVWDNANLSTVLNLSSYPTITVK